MNETAKVRGPARDCRSPEGSNYIASPSTAVGADRRE
jgi:hypothetical protein